MNASVKAGDADGRSIFTSDQTNPTRYWTELGAYATGVSVAKAIGLQNGKIDMSQLNAYLVEAYGVTPESPGTRLSG